MALSCETGITAAGDPEVVRVSAVDFFTGEVLVDSLVFPRVRMLHLNSRWSGVQWNMLYNARRNGTVLEGRDAARRKVCNFVGPNTILIMHNGGRQELEHLRWIHERVIDIEELESRRHKSVRLTTWKEGLSKLVRVHLQRKFQGSRLGNDTVETALALRDLTHWYMNNLEPRMKTKIDSNIVVTEEQMRVAEEYAKKSGTPMVPPDERYRWVIARNFPKDDERYHLYEYQSDDEPSDHDRA